MVESLHLLSECKVFQQRRTSGTSLQASKVIDRSTPVRCQEALLIVELKLTHELIGLVGGFLEASIVTLGHFTAHERAAAGKGSTSDHRKIQ